MKNLTLSSIAVSLMLLTGCAGLTDANLTEVDANQSEMTTTITNPADLRSNLESAEGTPTFRSDREEIIIRPPREEERD
jgi:PBP1b-binding outer membrane lipoprotein LpoB